MTVAQSPQDRGPQDRGEAIAIRALAFVAAEPELLSRFLALSGIEARNIRGAAAEPGFLSGVMQFVLAHEPTLLRFAEDSGLSPAEIAGAARRLPQGDESYDRSI